MPEYIANGLIHHRGKMHRSGDQLTLTDAQAEKLGDIVIKKTVVTAKVKDSDTKKLRQIAKEAGVKNYSSKTKGELTAEIKAIQDNVPVEAVKDDGSDAS